MELKEAKILDCIIKELYHDNHDVVSICRSLGIMDINRMKTIRMKLIEDRVAYNAANMFGDYSLVISSQGRLLFENGGYRRKARFEYLPPITSVIGCVTGVISLLWLIVSSFFF